MNKDQAMSELFAKVYGYKKKNVISKDEIKRIEKAFKDQQDKAANIEELLSVAKDEELSKLVNKLKSGKEELNQQLQQDKALQPGVLAECVYLQTLAEALGLKSFYNLETTPLSKLPKVPLQHIKNSADTSSSARYLYCNKKDSDVVLIQYGNPKAGDATAVLYDNEIIIEIKDMPAVVAEKDLLYDENGHLYFNDKTLKEVEDKYPYYVEAIKGFNDNHTVFEQFGSNYSLDGIPEEQRLQLIQSYLDAGNIDLILTSIADEIVCILPQDISRHFSDETPLISMAGSEIRSTGKNSKKPFTPEFLEQTISQLGGECSNNIYLIPVTAKTIGNTNARGHQDKVTRWKMNHAFWVPTKYLIQKDEYYQFPSDKVKQCKCSISIHIQIAKGIDKERIYQELYK